MKKYTVNILPQAENDLIKIAEYIANDLQNPASAVKTVQKIMRACEELGVFPRRSPILYNYKNKNLRSIHAKNYTILFHINDATQSVEVFAICYSRRDIAGLLKEN